MPARMRGYMFRNPWLALLFVGMTLASVAALIGTERDKGTLASAADEVGHQRAGSGPDAAAAAPAAPESAADAPVTVFADEGDLIDSAEGTDPSPADEGSADAGPAEAVPDSDAAGSADEDANAGQ
jgi:hypothetical protein